MSVWRVYSGRMTDLSTSAKNPQDRVDGNSRHEAAQEGEQIPRWWEPFSVLQYAIEKAEKREDVYDEYGRRKISSYGQLICFVLLCATMIGGLSWIGYLNSNRNVAIFTIVLAAVAIVQFMSSVYMFIAMHRQNEIMVKQMQQTDQVVEAMRLEQRAWISVDSAVLKPFTADKHCDFALRLLNSGKTPGRVTSGAVLMVVSEPDKTPKTIIETFNRKSTSIRESFIVTQGKTALLDITHLGPIPQEHIDDIHGRRKILHFVCKFRYVDVQGRRHTAKAFYTLDMDDRGLWMQKDYGSMD